MAPGRPHPPHAARVVIDRGLSLQAELAKAAKDAEARSRPSSPAALELQSALQAEVFAVEPGPEVEHESGAA